MKSVFTGFPIVVWAAREIQRRPGRHLLRLACLAGMVALTATAVLFSQALDTTWRRLLEQAPHLVIRRIDAGGWAPLPAEAAVSAARRVPGALDPTPRVWGVAQGPGGPVTVLAADGLLPQSMLRGLATPEAGQAVVGPSLAAGLADGRLTLTGQQTVAVTVIDRFPAASGLATDDLVWMSPGDVRTLLGLTDGQASDLAVFLFREEEQQAIQADLAAAFHWPVRITDRATGARRLHQQALRLGGSAIVACIPALLALLLIVTGTAAGGSGRQGQWGLFKALGWRTADLVRLRIAEAVIVALPATVLGLTAAYAAVFYPPAAGVTALWFMNGRHVPELVLSTSGAALTMLVIGALVGLPYLAAVCLTTLREAADDPFQLLQADPWN